MEFFLGIGLFCLLVTVGYLKKSDQPVIFALRSGVGLIALAFAGFVLWFISALLFPPAPYTPPVTDNSHAGEVIGNVYQHTGIFAPK